MTEYSVSTHCLQERPLEEALETLAPHTKYVEIMSEGPHFLENAKPLANFDLKWTIHAPSRGVNPASVLAPIREASVKVIADTCKVAAESNASGVVFHPGYFAWEHERCLSIRALQTSLNELRVAGEEYGVTFFVENMGNWGYFFLKEPGDFTLFEDCPFCLDIGHANECKTLDAFLEHPFSHIHLHDNNGNHDSHDAVGSGSIDFAKVLEKIAENRVEHPVVEVGTLEGVVKSLEVLRGME